MGTFTLYCWPYDENKAELAAQHFQQAKAGIHNLHLKDSAAFFLGRNTNYDTGLFVLWLTGTYRGGINDAQTLKELDNFFTQCGCPEYQERQSPYIGTDLTTVENFTETLFTHKVAVVAGPVIRRVKMECFSAETVEAAKALAQSAMQSRCVVGLDVLRQADSYQALGYGKNEAEAIQHANSKLSADAYDIRDARMIQAACEGVGEVQAYTEEEAGLLWRKDAFKEARLVDRKCVQPATKGLMGIGRKKGLWSFQWRVPCQVEVEYKRPAAVEAFYAEVEAF